MSDTTTTTIATNPLFRPGDRIVINGVARGKVTGISDSDCTLTIVARNAWYWKLAWWLEDRWQAFRDTLRIRTHT